VIAVFDLKHYLILDKVIFPAVGLSVLWNIYQDVTTHYSLLTTHSHLVLGLLSGLGLAGFFGLQFLLSKGRWIGFGDVKLGFLLGLMLGWPQILTALILAYFSGALVGLSLIAWGKKQMSSKLPFGVFLSGSAIVVILWGSQITNWYLRLIGL
jgi:prepilin signal peptidase PulO-like enzyme (type II secretory pathway)